MTKLVRILVDAGADMESRDTIYPRSTPVVLAVGDDDGGAICALLAAGADVSNAKGTSGNTGIFALTCLFLCCLYSLKLTLTFLL